MNSLLPKSELICSFLDIDFFSTVSDSDLESYKFIDSEKIHYTDLFLKDLWDEKHVNFTENKPSLHYCPRFFFNDTKNPPFRINKDVNKEINSMLSIADKIRNGFFGEITDILHIGTGGSHLGPEMIYDCFKYKLKGPKVHFFSNVDPLKLSSIQNCLNPNTSLCIVVSKSFNTIETITTFNRIKLWFKNHKFSDQDINKKIIAVTSNSNNALKHNLLHDNIVKFNNSIGGRYSIWSAANLITPTLFGKTFFKNFLLGGYQVDIHMSDHLLQSIPFKMAKRSYYSRLIRNEYAHCIVPYSDNLKFLPLYLQQLVMESNGKSIDRNDQNIISPCSNTYGYIGTDAQHSFFQSLHQSTLNTSIDLIAFKNIYEDITLIDKKFDEQAFSLLLNSCFSQFHALKDGSKTNVLQNQHREVKGRKNVNLILIDKLTETTLGNILCLYEYKTIIEASLSKVNPFDQFGVELGKTILNKSFK